jgi:hypothetical protein
MENHLVRITTASMKIKQYSRHGKLDEFEVSRTFHECLLKVVTHLEDQ